MQNGRSVGPFRTRRTVSRNSNATMKRYGDGACGRPLFDGRGTSAMWISWRLWNVASKTGS